MMHMNIVYIHNTGDTHLGGEDFDQRLLDWAIRELPSTRNHHTNSSNNSSNNTTSSHPALTLDAIARLRSACSSAKIALTDATSAEVK
jgi:molecular chaperone DnaK (HSP70)